MNQLTPSRDTATQLKLTRDQAFPALDILIWLSHRFERDTSFRLRTKGMFLLPEGRRCPPFRSLIQDIPLEGRAVSWPAWRRPHQICQPSQPESVRCCSGQDLHTPWEGWMWWECCKWCEGRRVQSFVVIKWPVRVEGSEESATETNVHSRR